MPLSVVDVLAGIPPNTEYHNWKPASAYPQDMSMSAGEYFTDIYGSDDVFGYEDEKRVSKLGSPFNNLATIRELWNAIDTAPMIKIPNYVWDHLEYAETTSTTTRDMAISIASSYGDTGDQWSTGYYKRLKRVIDAISEGIALPAPVVLSAQGRFRILSGNRRLIASSFHEIIPLVHIIKI